jgi:FAD/FMN-containing dehydrogenase
MAASTGARRPLAFVEDTAVAPERLNEYVARFREVLDRHGLTAGSTVTAPSAACTSAPTWT